MKILIADDDKALVQSLTRRLAERGFEIYTAFDAVQAWMSIMRIVPSAVVLDLSMPGGTGMDILKRLRLSTRVGSIPALVISESSNPEVASTAKRLGADEFLVKPFAIEDLVTCLERLVGEGTPMPFDARKHAAEESGNPPMRVLVADDDGGLRRAVEGMIARWGYQGVSAKDGEEAWKILQNEDAPRLAILDWLMPGMEGVEICRKLREQRRDTYVYVILLTCQDSKTSLVEGMDAGADDYIAKPFDAQELRVRLAAGRRILGLQEDLLSARARMWAGLGKSAGARS